MATPTQIARGHFDPGMPDYLMTNRAAPEQITFTPQQLELLERVFPEMAVGSDAMPDAKIRHHLGQRSVVAYIRDKVRR